MLADGSLYLYAVDRDREPLCLYICSYSVCTRAPVQERERGKSVGERELREVVVMIRKIFSRIGREKGK